MQKKNIVFIALFFWVSVLAAQVNFEQQFSFDKFHQEDTLWDIQLFDYNDDGIDEVAITYYYFSSGNEEWKFVLYDQSGDTLKVLTYGNNDDFMNLFHCVRYCGNSYLFRATINYNDPWIMSLFVYDFTTMQTIDSLIVNRGRTEVFWEIHEINQVLINTIPIFLVGVSQGSYTREGISRSYIQGIKFENNELFSVGELENCGLSCCVDNASKLVSTGLYSLGAVPTTDNRYYLKSITKELPFETQQLFTISGMQSWDVPSVFNHFPYHFCLLTFNEQAGGPHVLYYHLYDSVGGDSVFFRGFDVENNYEVWSVKNPLIEMQEITSSTCIPVNDEDHYVMYFYDNNTLEIRDRVSVNVVHQQDSVLAVCDILRKRDGELLFFVEKDDETGYDVYTLDGPIFVSADKPPAQNEVVLQNSPNPFSTSTTISFYGTTNYHELSQISIYNIKGQLVRVLLPVAPSPSRPVSVTWDGKDDKGNVVKNGVYLYKIVNNGKIISGKTLKIK